MRNGFVVSPIMIWVAIAAFTILAISKAGSSSTSNQTINQQPSSSQAPTSIPATSSDLVNPVKHFYSDLSTKQYYDAWTLLSKNFQNYAQNYDNFAKGYNTTTNITVKGIFVQDFSDNTVYVELDAADKINGQFRNNSYAGTWKLVWENGIWKLDTANINLLNPVVDTNIPTPAPTNSPVIHDGSRTGKIIDYFELATGQHISIYENELLSYTFSDGTKSYLTQGDINWYEKKYAKPNLVNSNIISPSTRPNQPSYYPSYPTYTPPPAFGNGSVNLIPTGSGAYKGYDSNGNTVLLNPTSGGGLIGNDSNGNSVNLLPPIGGGDYFTGYSGGNSFLLKPGFNDSYTGTGY